MEHELREATQALTEARASPPEKAWPLLQKAQERVDVAKKLANGYFPSQGAHKAVNALHSDTCQTALLTPFADLLAPDALKIVRRLVSTLQSRRQGRGSFRPRGCSDNDGRWLVPIRKNG